LTLRPAAAFGIASSVHRFALTTFTTGISASSGAGSTGWKPVPAATGSRAALPQALPTKAAPMNRLARIELCLINALLGKNQASDNERIPFALPGPANDIRLAANARRWQYEGNRL
jgi:hypothetical protein